MAIFAGDLWALLTPEGQRFDVAAYHAIHDTYRAPWLDDTMRLATKIGETKSGLYGLAFFAFFGTPTAQVTAKLAAVSILGSSAITQALKWIVARERPTFSDDQRHNASFPSQHASGAAAVAVLISRRHGRLGWFAWGLALWIGLSRIYLGRHYPTDVLTGYLFGAIASWLVLRGERWFEKLHF